MAKRLAAPFRKSDLLPAFEAGRAAGYDQVSVVINTPDGKRFEITAGTKEAVQKPHLSEVDKWKASHAQG